VPLVRSLRYASRGIDYYRDPTQDPWRLKPVYARPLASWSSTSKPSPLIKAFRHYLPLAIISHNVAFPEFQASSPKVFISRHPPWSSKQDLRTAPIPSHDNRH
jgi:hypothetical protein